MLSLSFQVECSLGAEQDQPFLLYQVRYLYTVQFILYQVRYLYNS